MKIKFTVFILALALLATPALAQTNIPSNGEEMRAEIEARRAEYEAKRAAVRAEMEAKRAELRAEMETRRAEVKSNIEERRASSTERMEMRKASSTARRLEFQKEIAERHAERAATVLSATVERLMNIIDRIESRIDKVKVAGGSTTASEEAVSRAKANLVDAEADIAALKAIDLTGDTAQENFEFVRTAAKSAKEDIRQAHTNLKDAVSSLKGQRGGMSTTTPQN